MDLNTLVPLDTPAQRARAIQALPRTLELALEGNPFYYRLLWETQVGLATYYSCWWMWFYPPTPNPLFHD